MNRDMGRSLRAEATGSLAEGTIRAVLLGRGYAEIRPEALHAPYVEQTPLFGSRTLAPRPKRIFITQHLIARSIYDSPLMTDFWLDGVPSFPNGLALEVKWQQSTGSVDEKFPYLVLNIKTCYPCPAIIIADGGGQRPGALQWLRGQTDPSLLAVLSLSEFVAWANRSL